ncbi:VWA domain-containing protein [Pseudidiomarina andamanensis]|uniref:VWA domain-containing protein n=1 Tax=Pseudidiomarina andamanensis TaxID=1940690 RepID=A0AA92EQS3_9GAMM|nr:VWA domain-containing protein [Pseudidiomarina andamanensis]MDS0217930.1 VWA domain-containing protein [Pseudidiomarina andamanensis]QGT94826.1 VWA domain-containing protein [Pseudidiomarina andamanensis]
MADFHFLRPWWLLTLIPVVIITWWAWRHAHEKQGWSKIIPAHLQAILLPRNGQRSGRFQLMLVGLALSCSALALAGPAWQKLPQPVYQLKAGSVVVMDMSLSVYSTDLPPNRLSQMRFKATDLVTEHIDGDIGLIAYAGDAFTISPLTADGSNLTNLIRALSPDIMPTPGSYPVRALELADQLLKEAGYPEGDIYWLTDGIDSRDQTDIGDFINRTAHRLNILAVGTEAGAPIQLPDGRLLRDSSDNVVIPKLSVGGLPVLAERSGGRFIQIRADQQDIVYLTSQAPTTRDGDKSSMQAGDQWADQGPWLIPLILLLLLPLARRGRLLSMAPLLFVIALSHPVYAAQQEPLAWHEKLWQTPYQQADQALKNGNYERAATITDNAWQRGTANYRAGNYDQALVDFSQLDSAEGFYNQGNSLMQLQRYDEAKNAYAAALERRPDWTEAQQNLDLAKQLAEQQQQNQSNQQGQSQQQQNSDQNSNQNADQSSEQNAKQDAEQQTEKNQSQTDQSQQQQQQAEQTKESDSQEQSEAEQKAREGEEKPLQSQLGDPSEEELQQQMQQWLNRIEDDPAVLLRNKMQFEAQQRRRQGSPPGVEKSW